MQKYERVCQTKLSTPIEVVEIFGNIIDTFTIQWFFILIEGITVGGWLELRKEILNQGKNKMRINEHQKLSKMAINTQKGKK